MNEPGNHRALAHPGGWDKVKPTRMAAQVQDERHADTEVEFVAGLVRSASNAGVQADRASLVDFYVPVKSQPLAVLIGAHNTGKIALVEALANALTDGDPMRRQSMIGHAWWAAGSGNVTLFTEAQWRFNAEKILSLIEEARRPTNAHRVHIACLLRISPAELTELLTPLAAQLRRTGPVYYPTSGLTEPVLIPANFLLIGTMDTATPDWLLGNHGPTPVILRRSETRPEPSSPSPVVDIGPSEEFNFRQVCIRDEHTACQRLRQILGRDTRPLRPLLQIEALLQHSGVRVGRSEYSQAVVYLANAWSADGAGLFERGAHPNMRAAMDIAIERILLSYAGGISRGPADLSQALRKVVADDYTRAASVLEWLLRRCSSG